MWKKTKIKFFECLVFGEVNIMALAAKKNVRSTTRQIDMLVDYMSNHIQFAKGEFRGSLGREDQFEEWVRVKKMLQKYGPNKTVEQWRMTWRDLKKKARADGARVNSALAKTGNRTPILSLSETSTKILNILGRKSAYGMAGQKETGLGKIVPQPPPVTSKLSPTATAKLSPTARSSPASSPLPPTSPVSSPPDTSPPDTSPPDTAPPDTAPPDTAPPDTALSNTNPGSVPRLMPPSTPSTQQAARQASAHGQLARSLKNDFLVSDAETISMLQDIKNCQAEKNKLTDRKMRRSHLQRIHSARMDKHRNMGPKN